MISMHENSCLWVLPNFEYLCLNKICNCAHVVSPKGSKEWYHNLASPNSVRQNLCTFMPASKWWASIQSFEHKRCASASSSGFPENSGLKFDQLRCMCLCLTASWWWGYSCPCLWLGTAAPSSLFAIILAHMLCLPIPNVINLFTQLRKFQHVPNVWILWLSDGKSCSFFHKTSNLVCWLTSKIFLSKSLTGVLDDENFWILSTQMIK